MENAEVPQLERPKTKQEEWKDFMPPDNFVPDWKLQFQAMDREVALRKLADRALFAAVGFALATAMSLVPALIIVKLIVLGTILVVYAYAAITALRMRLKAAEIDNKLNETVRVEPERKE